MTSARFAELSSKYSQLRIAVVGDFCLDRYLEIDPGRQETSIETGLPVHNVVNVRSQPGAAGTILNNLAALKVAEIYPIGFCGEDGEGFELRRSLSRRRGVKMDHFLETDLRRTFTYCKPLLMGTGKAPVELNRLDSKNWTPTPGLLQELIAGRIEKVCKFADAVIIMDQVDVPETGVVARHILESIQSIVERNPQLLVVADSRRGLRGYPPVCLKMNAAELSALTGTEHRSSIKAVCESTSALARHHGRPVFVTLAEQGIVGAAPDAAAEHVPALPVRGEIDIVGAGDSVTANLTATLAAGGTVKEAIEIANVAASIVIHQLGTTGTAKVQQIADLLPKE